MPDEAPVTIAKGFCMPPFSFPAGKGDNNPIVPMFPWSEPVSGLDSVLHEELARHFGQALDAGLGDDDALGDLEAHGLEPETGHEVESHARLENAAVAGPQAHGPLAPIGRIGDADRITGTVVLDDAVFLED